MFFTMKNKHFIPERCNEKLIIQDNCLFISFSVQYLTLGVTDCICVSSLQRRWLTSVNAPHAVGNQGAKLKFIGFYDQTPSTQSMNF